ncbi:MAG: hypothetical protein ACP5L3_06530, partial [Caldisericum sp.]|uniref:hypothetical protein n=1 Tax=Caldisericum sp. TaxID=2499687 RepID=UPI003D1498D3
FTPNISVSEINYSFAEQQLPNPPVYLNLTYFNFSMADISAPINFSTPVQYYPILAHTPTWTAKPSNWSIIVTNELNTNEHLVNNSIGFQFDTSNLQVSFANAIKLNYPFTSFTLNLNNNPAVQKNLTLIPFNIVSSNSITNSLYNRKIMLVNAYSEETANLLSVNTTFSSIFLLNNYTFNVSKVIMPTTVIGTTNQISNSVDVYIPFSNYQNPKLSIFNPTFFSYSTSYYPRQNNFYNWNISNGTWKSINIYLPLTNDSSLYGMSVSTCSGLVPQGDYVIVKHGVQGSQIAIQQLRITTVPFSIALINNYPYQFSFYNANGILIYNSSISTWTSPITIGLPCVNIVPKAAGTQIVTNCTSTNLPGNQLSITCKGTDLNNQVQEWIVNITSQPTILSSKTWNSITINSLSFSQTFIMPTNKTQYYAHITALYGIQSDPMQVFAYVINPNGLILQNNNIFLLALLLFLIPLGIAYFNKTLMLLAYIIIIFVGQALSIFSFSVFDVSAFIIISLISIVLSERKTNGN